MAPVNLRIATKLAIARLHELVSATASVIAGTDAIRRVDHPALRQRRLETPQAIDTRREIGLPAEIEDLPTEGFECVTDQCGYRHFRHR